MAGKVGECERDGGMVTLAAHCSRGMLLTGTRFGSTKSRKGPGGPKDEVWMWSEGDSKSTVQQGQLQLDRTSIFGR